MGQRFFWTIFKNYLILFQKIMSRDKLMRRKIAGRPYKSYSDRQMELCLSDIDNKILTQRAAAEKYKIPRSSIVLKLKAIRQNKVRKPGRQCFFTEAEEAAFVEHAAEMCDYGFPITIFDLRCIVKMYLDRKGRKIDQFPNNLPGKTWAILFLKRHKNELSQRLCNNIKRVRAAVDEEQVQSYFEHLKIETEGVSPYHIYNYDETNLVDDPGKKKVLTKRGRKYPEAIKNSTKAAVSLMICGNAAGEILPPYVNYKSDNLWTTWTEGGPPHARYNRSKSGWFDTSTFEDWFFTLLLPALRRQEGKKVLIGDNLSSHINVEVLKACKEHNIAFVALPPNSTHPTQPLDVAFFRPLKIRWRQILDEWKETPEGQRSPTIPKNMFPALLKKLWEKIMDSSADNLKAGFKKTGIFPTDAMPVLQRLPGFKDPDAPQQDSSLISESFVEYLENKRKEVVGIGGNKGRKKKLNVTAGKSISAEEVDKAQLITSKESKEKPSSVNDKDHSQPSSKNSRRKSKKKPIVGLSSESEDDTEIQYASDTTMDLSDELFVNEPPNLTMFLPKADEYVLVEYEGETWPGQVQSVDVDGAYVNCMMRCGLAWKWPEKQDCIFYPINKIISAIKPPLKLSTKRALFRVPELEYKWGTPKK